MNQGTNQLTLVTRSHNDCLERIFQTIRYRRFHVEQFSLSRQERSFHITLNLSGSRSIDRLTSQLAKLYDVLELRLDHAQEEGRYVKSA